MRILIAHHFPLDDAPAAAHARQIATALLQAGHEARLLVVTDQPAGNTADAALPTTSIVCRAGDSAAPLDFALPGFDADPAGRPSFSALSEDQFAHYREVLRQILDREVDSFNPHLVHVEHVWLWAQLVLETGVPYVVSAWPPELTSCRGITRIRDLAQQAAENASRILVPDASQAAAVHSAFDVPPERITLLPPGPALAERCLEIYRAAWAERFGNPPD